MNCVEVQRILPEVLENGQDAEFGAHLKSCPACSELVSDLQAISAGAMELSALEEPPPRVWLRIAAELRAEGIIREPEVVRPSPATPKRGWRAWWLVPVAATVLAGAFYFVSHRPASTVAQQNPSAVQAPAPAESASQAPVAQAPVAEAPATVSQAVPPKGLGHQKAGDRIVEPAPSADDQQFLSEVSQRAPSMRAAYEDQLRSVNAYIRAAQAYLDRNPDDEEARQHLMEAYQQKALLYQLALDHIQ
jgi:hypothetical protein